MPQAWTRFALWLRWRFVSPFLSSHRRMLWCLLLLFRCCLGICLFWLCWLQFATLQSWSLGFSSSHRCCCCCAHQCCFHFYFLRFLVQIRLAHCRRIIFVEFSKDNGNPFTRRDDFFSPILYLCDEHFLLCRLIPGMFLTPFEVFECSLDVLLSCHFLSLIHFLHLLISFSCCFSSLGVLLLSSMSLRISTSFLKSPQSLLLLLSRLLLHRLFFPSFMSLLTCDTIEPASTTGCAHRAWWSSPTVWSDSSFTVLRSGCSLPVTPAVSTATSSMGFCGRAFSSFYHFRSRYRFVLHSHSCCCASFSFFRPCRRSGRVRHDRCETRCDLPLRSLCEVLDVHDVSTCFICRLHAVIHHASRAHSFDFFCFRFSIFTLCFCCCCCVLIFCLCFCIFTFCLLCGFFFCGGVFFSMISWYLFSSSGFSTSMFLSVWSLLPYHVVFPFKILVMVILSRRGDRERRHDTSLVTSHVDHVVGFGVLVVSQVSSLG